VNRLVKLVFPRIPPFQPVHELFKTLTGL